MATGVSTASIFREAIATFKRVQGEIFTVNKQIASGIRSDTFSGLNTSIRRISSLESTIRRSDIYIENIDVALLRVRSMDATLTRMEEMAQELRSNIALRRSDSDGENLPLGALCEDQLELLQEAMNTKAGDFYIFSGSKLDVRPVDDLQDSNLNSAGEVTANYYQGDTVENSVRISDGLTIEYGITGDNEAFQNLIGALHKAIEGHNADDDDALAEGLDLVNEAIGQLATLRSSVNSNLITLENMKTQHENIKLHSQDLLSNDIGVDVAEASIRLAYNQTVLTASFQTFSRISNLNLADYLR